MRTIDREDIQGNILEGYTFPHVMHLLATFVDAPRGRQALAELRTLITTATRWDTKSRPRSAINLGLSAAGLRALNSSASLSTSGFPEAFRQGMHARAARLGDDPAHYDPVWREPERIHLWLWVHGSTEHELERLRQDLQQRLSGLATLLEPAIRGTALRNEKGESVEHFGFRDGMSGPAIAGSTTPAKPGDGNLDPDGKWRPIATGEFVLGHVDESGAVAALPARDLSLNGTFAVFRKLGQDVAGFRAYVKKQAETFRATGAPVDEHWVAARMVGRERDGTPLSRDPLARDSRTNNAFTFGDDPEGRVCPLGSHIRRGNPRNGHGFAGAFARHRILRRSMSFGHRLPEGDTQTSASREQRFAQRGLLFIAVNADIERQFEFLQRQYMNDGAAARQGADADPLVGSHPREGSDFIIPGDPSQRRATLICPRVPRFVECLGGEYFFLPGMRALEMLAGEGAQLDVPVVEILGSSAANPVGETIEAAAMHPEVSP
jgi:Dyp-type peroxidase family